MKRCGLGNDAFVAMYEGYQQSIHLASCWVNQSFFTKKIIRSRGLSRFPLSLLMMTHLRVLDLNDNVISELPSRISDLQFLRELHLENNRLEFLPVSLSEITSLKVLQLYGNPLKSPPKEIVSRGRFSCVFFFFFSSLTFR
jgi:Leucine-rich repeat (LRR) protein